MQIIRSKTDHIQRRVLDNLSTSVLVLDSELKITYINPACEMLFAVSARKASKRTWHQLVSAPVELGIRMKDTLVSGHPFTEREIQLEINGHRQLTVDCSVTPLNEPNSVPALLVELAYMDRQLRISKEERLMTQQHAASALIRGLAHEIKNPLGGLRGAAQLLQGELADPELTEYTGVIIEEADRLQNLLDRMLGPKHLPVKATVNIHRIVERVRTLLAAEMSDGVTLIRDYDPSIPPIHADAEQLIQAILNLARNALHAIGESGQIVLRTRTKRQFTIGQTTHKLVVVVEVQDNGPGIPEDMLNTIFYPMITGRADGTGLGLSIAQSLINRHGGLIECSSEPGHTVFRMLLPMESTQ